MMSHLRSHLSRTCLAVGILVASQLTVYALRIPAHVFPDEDAEVITHLSLSESEARTYPKVLDASLEGTWYWTTHKGEFIGYVSKRDIERGNRLKPNTMIRVDPTYSSWTLTRYEPGDDVRVRSRLSVGRVSIRKEIPVYFQLPSDSRKPDPFETKPVDTTPETEPDTRDPDPQTVRITAPASLEVPDQMEVVDPMEESPEDPVVDDSTESAEPDAVVETQPEVDTSIEVDTPEPGAFTSTPEDPGTPAQPETDPLLEEQPRISPQELADMAPPPSTIFQEFEGYLRLVPEEDPGAEQFQYQLETRSGQRIVYVDTSDIVGGSFEELVDSWINIRGSLEETDPDFTLYIEAKNIWVAP